MGIGGEVSGQATGDIVTSATLAFQDDHSKADQVKDSSLGGVYVICCVFHKSNPKTDGCRWKHGVGVGV